MVLTPGVSFQTDRFCLAKNSPRKDVRFVALGRSASKLVHRPQYSRNSPLLRAHDLIDKAVAAWGLRKHSYFLTRVVFLRALAFVYGVAFLVAKHQNRALIGDNGITPAKYILDRAEAQAELIRKRREAWLNSPVAGKPVVKGENQNNLLFQIRNSKFARDTGMKINRNSRFQYWRQRLWDRQDGMGRPVTTLLWLAKDRNHLNPWLDGIANWGLGMSIAVFAMGAANVPLMLGLWLCQRSLMAVGGPFYGYGWEPQLAELGFHALFLVPFLSLHPFFAASPPSPIVIYAIRWYLFRIMMGAGLIKWKSGDIKWKWPHLSSMNYFYETQPVPNPWTRFFHFKPTTWHKFEVLTNHFVELLCPFLLLAPICSWRRLGALIQIVFQAVLISSGNLSFLNWLTAVPAIMCLDDAFLSCLFTSSWKRMASDAFYMARASRSRQFVSLIFGLTIAGLSVPVVKNLLAKRQLMNASFDPLRLVNTYGAFGTVDEERYEFIVSAASNLDDGWKEYHFKVKPGDVFRKPRFISPYHYRLDWQIWIASTIRNIDRSPWIYSFLFRLLEQDPDVLSLLESDPFEGEPESPKYIRIDKYRYKFQKPDRKDDGKQPYWTRELIGQAFPPRGVATLETLHDYVHFINEY